MTDAERSEDKHMREQRLQRNLKILVIGLGLFMLLALAAVVVGMITQSGKNSQNAQHSLALPNQAASSLALELPVSAKIVSISLSGNRLAIHYDSQAGSGISIIDLETGQRTLEIKPTVALPKN